LATLVSDQETLVISK